MMIRQSAVGSKHLCILTSDAQVRCIGDNSMNQLEYPDDLGPIVDLDAGFSHTCAVEQSGRLHCWGGNDYEQVSLTLEGLTSISLVEIEAITDGETAKWYVGDLIRKVRPQFHRNLSQVKTLRLDSITLAPYPEPEP